MGWFSSFFSSTAASASARRKMTMSTHDAFSLPTSSPLTASHPDSFARPSPDGLDVEVMTPSSSTYAYPPPASPTTYDYVPRQNGRLLSSQSRQSSLLPLHNNAPLSPLPPYPPLEQTWGRLQRWLSREYPELGDTLNYGILPQDFADIEMALGFALPSPVRESCLLVDGQEAESSAGCSEGLFFGLSFLPLEDALEEWRFWREVDSDPATGANPRLKDVMKSIPPGWVRRQYSQRGWIPLVTDKTGNYLGVDLNPDEGGAVGQVIVFGRDFDTKVVMWRGDGIGGWATWLAGFVDDLENGEGYELGQASEGSEGSEDDVGYESYFFDGSGRAKGEGDGDAGAGLRLTGEYRGWSVLEAWADKSVKKWRQSGAFVEESSPNPPKPKAKTAKHGLGVLDLAAPSLSAAEVPIPVLSDDQATPTAATINMSDRTPTANNNPNKTPSPLPTISVTKAPAPLPVHLPSPQDFQSPSPTDSRGTSFDNDLERGGKLSLDEVDGPQTITPISEKLTSSTTTPTIRRPNDSVSSVKEATLVHIPLNEPSPENSSEDVTDLLQENDSATVAIAPLEPVSTPIAETKAQLDELPVVASPTPEPPSTVPISTPAGNTAAVDEETPDANPVENLGEDKSEMKEVAEDKPDTSIDEDPDQTIRLVGGGGMAGVVAEPETNADAADADLDEVTSVSSSTRNSTDVESVNGTKGGKHEKKKSFSQGLKRISKFGGAKRRTDSKEKVGEP